jgi:hypothetical protein
MEWAIAHNLFIRFFEAFLSKHILVVREPQIHLLLLTAKWYHFQPKTWYIIQPVHTLIVMDVPLGLKKLGFIKRRKQQWS